MTPDTIAWLILLLPLAAAASIVLGLRHFSGVSALISTGSVLITLILSFLFSNIEVGKIVVSLPWLDLGDWFFRPKPEAAEKVSTAITLGIKIDALSQGMMIVVTGVGALVHIFSLGYMRDDEGKSRYFAGLSLFMFSMTGIVLADNFVMMFIFWELVGVSSYILIGHWFDKDAPAEAAKKAFLTNRIGDFGFMIGILLVWVLTGSVYFDDIADAVGGVGNATLLNVAVLLVFCGAVGKSAQFPLHVWLPDAMEGPTPVSALIHAATMVAAGVFMLARVWFLVGTAELAGDVIAWTGAITALLAALMAIQQNDIKRILAYSTLSQLGYMVMAQGLVVIPENWVPGGDAPEFAGMFHLYTHAWFKALLFLGAGAVIFACHHEQNIWKMGGLRHRMPKTFWCFVLGTAALIAVPLTSGFWSKEAILETAWGHQHYGIWTIGIIVALLTPFYMTRLVVVAFFGKSRTDHSEHAREVHLVMWAPLAVLAVLSVLSAYDPIAYAFKAQGHADLGHLAHGLASPTGIASLACLILGVGAAWFVYKGRDTDPVNIPLFARKFYFDDLYLVVVRVFQDFVAAILDAIDRYIIDPITARAPALGSMGLGYLLRLIQVGNLQAYALLFGAGAVGLIWFLIS